MEKHVQAIPSRVANGKAGAMTKTTTRLIDRCLKPKLVEALEKLDAMPLRVESFEQWKAARAAVVRCYIIVSELQKMEEWIR
jgi:hypothetical protein